MRQFLLGDLPDSDANALEVELLRDDEKFEQMWEIENELVDAYVRGRLPTAERERFERHYLASPVHVQRVAVARRLIEEADGPAPVATTVATTPARPALFERLGFSRPAWGYAFATILALLAVATIWLFMERARLRRELAETRTDTESRRNQEKTLSDQIAGAREQNARTSSELEQLRTQNTGQTSHNTAEQTPSPSILSFALSPVLVRGSSDQQTVRIPTKVDMVRLQLTDNNSEARQFQISIRTVEGRIVWQQRNSRSGKGTISAQVPGNKLPPGDYIATVSSVGPTGSLEEINRYFFRVVAR
jgi:hypothetical protein